MADRKKIDTLIQQGDQLAAQGRWDQAMGAYGQALELAPEDVQLRDHILEAATRRGDYGEVISQCMALAELFAAQGEVDQAIERYKIIVNLEQSVRKKGFGGEEASEIQNRVAQVKPEIFSRIGRFYLDKGDHDESVGWLRSSLDIDPGRWDTHMALGRALMAQSKDKEAIGEFQEVVRLAPNEAAQAYEMLGEVFIRAGRQPQTTVVWFRNAGELYMQRKQMVDAIRTYERILEYESRNKDILVKLAEIYASEGRTEQAVETYRTLAGIYQEEGLLDKVIGFYEKLLDCDPQNEEARNQVIDIYRNILARDPSNTSVRLRLVENLLRRGMTAEAGEQQLALARSHLERGMIEEALPVARKLLELDPGNIEARKLMGEVYRKKDMNSEALTEFQQVVRLYQDAGDESAAMDFQHRLVELFPEASDLQYQVGLTLRGQGDHDGAVRELLRLLGERPDDLLARVYLAEEYSALDRWDEAVETYRTVLAQEPGRLDVRKRLVKYCLESGRLEEALQEIQALPEEDFERGNLLCRLIEKELADGHLEEVEGHLDRLLDDDERKVGFRKDLIKRYLDANDLEKADAAMPLVPRSDKERNRLVTRLMEMYLNSGNLETAAELINRLPAEDPLRLSFQRRLIGSYQDTGRLEEAAAELARLPEGDESRPDFLARQISGLLTANRLSEAIREIERLPEADPARNSFMGQLIEAYLQSGDIDRAAEEVGRLSLEDEIRPRYRRRIIQAYLNANRLEDAERDIHALDPGDPEKRSFLRLLLQKFEATGQMDRLREMVLHLPDDMDEKQQYLDGIVHNYLMSGDLAQARQEVYQMAESVSATGNHQEAERLYRELLAYHPADVEIRLRLSHEVACQGKLERAREGMLVLAGRFHSEGNATSAADIYSRLLEIDPENLNARYRLGHIWAEHGQTAQALEQFSQLAKVYLLQNLPEVAQRVLHRILELEPKDIPHRRQLIQLLTRNLRFDEATEHYRMLLGIHLDRGEIDEARLCVREIVNLQPLNLELRQRLGEMFLKTGFLEEGQKLMEELASTYKGRGDHEHVIQVFWTLSRTFEDNQQWETALEYRERVADELVEAEDWKEAQEQYLHTLEQYLVRGRKERTDPLFVKLIDGFFRHKNVPEGISRIERLEESFLDQGRKGISLIVKDRLAGIMERMEEWDRALELVEAISTRYLELGEHEQAIAYSRRAADLALNHQRVEHGLGLLFRLAELVLAYRGVEAAHPVLEEIGRRSGEEPRVLEQIGDLLFNAEHFEEARPYYDEVLRREPGCAGALSRVAIIYARQERLEEAAGVARQIFAKGLVGRIVSEYRQAVGYSPEDAGSQIKMGEFYRQMGFLEEAIQEFYRASRDPGKMLLAVNHLAMAFKEKGYRDLAIRQFLKALDQPGFMDDDLLDLRYNLGQVLEEEGRFNEALQAYQECYAVDIRFRDVSERIEVLFERLQSDSDGGNLGEYGEPADNWGREV